MDTLIEFQKEKIPRKRRMLNFRPDPKIHRPQLTLITFERPARR